MNRPDEIDPKEALKSAVAAAGGPTGLAKGVNEISLPMPPTKPKGSGHVSKWLERGACPPDMVLRVEAATKVSRHQLRPDIFGYEPVPAPQVQE